MKNLTRAFAIVERIALGPPATQAELMRELNIARSTVSDTLGELTELGYVAPVGRRYVPGARMMSFVLRASRHGGLATGVGGVLRDLVAATGETAIYVVAVPGEVSGGSVVAVAQAEARHELRYVADIGKLFPARDTVAGRAILAFGDEAVAGLDAAERALIRARGFALTEGDARGATTIAAPVFQQGGYVMGAISLIGPADRMPDPPRGVWPALKAATAAIGAGAAET